MTKLCTADVFQSHFSDWLVEAIPEFGYSARPAHSPEGLRNFARALTTNRNSSGTDVNEGEIAVATAHLSHLLRDREPSSTAVEEFHASDAKALLTEVNEVYALTHMRNRRLFRTTSGSIGLGPKITRPGDIVW